MRDALLLDSHALLWWQAESPRLSKRSLAAIGSASRLLISPISCWEVAMLQARGRIALGRPTATWIHDLLADGRVTAVPLSPAVAVIAGELENFHGDPADRIIVATALEHRLELVTKDERIHAFATRTGDVRIVW